MNLKRFWMGLSVAAMLAGSSSSAFAANPTLTFLGIDLSTPYSTSGNDDLRVGIAQWIDGKFYVEAYDLKTCRAFFLLRNGAVMQSGLSGHSAIRLGGGSQDVLYVMDQTSRTVGGPNADFCSNLAVLSSMNFNGFSLEIYGEDGNDVIDPSSRGNATVYGGPGGDRLTARTSLTVMFGDAGSDTLDNVTNSQCLMYGGDQADLLVDTISDGAVRGETYFGEGGNDCIWDSNGFQKIDCGAGSDRYANNLGTVLNCEAQSASFTDCQNYFIAQANAGN